MKFRIKDIVGKWKLLKTTQGFRELATFLIFVLIAASFWVIMALNDSVQDSFDVKINITDVPDSVTFITDPAEKVHLSVRDKGTSLLRHGWLHHNQVNFSFKDYASDGVLRIGRSDFLSRLKETFGAGAQLSSISLDSVRATYTTDRGRRVPVSIEADVTAASGKLISDKFHCKPSAVRIYAVDNEMLDTIRYVVTQKILRRNLSETTVVEVSLMPIPGVRIIPSSVKVTIPVEPLVSKETYVTVTPCNVPTGENLLLFPARVAVTYYVPMSQFNDDESGLQVIVDYEDIKRIYSDRLPVRLGNVPSGLRNVILKTDSVEYTLIRE